ncbi:MAG: tyrosine-type recombinase/integrase [Planctomycetota bacterium]|nr:tyrosine-type recombinase/integrase [Planctomycetota bacterium]
MLSAFRPEPKGPWFFTSPNGCRWNPDNFSQELRQANTAAGLPCPDNFSQELRQANTAAGLPWHCLDFRHTFGTHLAQKGVSLYKIAELMGNSPEICRRQPGQGTPIPAAHRPDRRELVAGESGRDGYAGGRNAGSGKR